MRTLPSLSAIEALDHLARLGSMARAAEALNQTPGAVSHKIKSLENRLGFPWLSLQIVCVHGMFLSD